MVFNPDRFLPKEGPPQLDPRKIVFGYGRRVCPGKSSHDSHTKRTAESSHANP